MTHSASARVTFTVEVKVRSGWGPDCTVDQVHRQAAEEARERLGRMIEEDRARDGAVRVVGELKVTAIIVEREER